MLSTHVLDKVVIQLKLTVVKHYKGSKAEIEKIISRKEPRALDSIIISPAAKQTA